MENAWPYRKERMINFVLKQGFDVIGFQEASPLMVDDLKSGLSDVYDVIFQPRDERGEGTPIFYKKGLRPSMSGTKWLTETPDISSNLKGSHFPRIVTYARFNDFIFFNTHLDYASDEICLRQSEILVDLINQIKDQDEPMVLTGDFNMEPNSKTITFMKSRFKTFYEEAAEDLLTYHAFSDRILGQPIDYIFFTPQVLPHDFKIYHHEVKGVYISDHYPISFHMKLKK
ncbi:MAG: hypothetical protein A2558_05360 [Tenericutes bacterium RIFOXYD2_FULL_35_11]|nr:MAG: hypothetical protein A2558_05360 [Tenericutes bacterium RIFOXYD2_FULL_35_11]